MGYSSLACLLNSDGPQSYLLGPSTSSSVYTLFLGYFLHSHDLNYHLMLMTFKYSESIVSTCLQNIHLEGPQVPHVYPNPQWNLSSSFSHFSCHASCLSTSQWPKPKPQTMLHALLPSHHTSPFSISPISVLLHLHTSGHTSGHCLLKSSGFCWSLYLYLFFGLPHKPIFHTEARKAILEYKDDITYIL